MAATIKLMKTGKRGYPTYRIIVIDKRKPRNGRYIEKIGIYNPHTQPITLQYDETKLKSWLKKGAEATEGIRKLFIKKGYF